MFVLVQSAEEGRSDKKYPKLEEDDRRRLEAQYAEANTEDTVRRTVDAWNRHDLNAIVAMYSPDVVRYGGTRPEGVRGREANRKNIEDSLKAFPDLHFEVSNIIAKGDISWCELEATGTHKGTFQTPAGPIPPTNRSVKARGANFARVSRGQIVEERVYFDFADLMRQLGLSQQK